ncbi:MAG: hypothetical protein QME94_17335, partial [Anaerolineae bacterium]|nr:hypothetical protein [Anaerolineae bacterium]
KAQRALRGLEYVTGLAGDFITPGMGKIVKEQHAFTRSFDAINEMRQSELQDYQAIQETLGLDKNIGVFQWDLR